MTGLYEDTLPYIVFSLLAALGLCCLFCLCSWCSKATPSINRHTLLLHACASV